MFLGFRTAREIRFRRPNDDRFGSFRVISVGGVSDLDGLRDFWFIAVTSSILRTLPF